MMPETQMTVRDDSPGTVLVVDDALDSLGMLCDALAVERYAVLAARDSVEALQRFDMTLPDAVLLDALMPGKDGFALCRQIKSEPAWSHVPVIFMTGLSETEQIVRAFSCGGVDYVIKPLKIPEVLARLSAHIRNATAARLAREAVDIAGMGIVLMDRHGRVSWRSPQAIRFLEQAFGQYGNGLAAAWIKEAVQSQQSLKALPNGSRIHARRVGQAEFGETMILLRQLALDTAPLCSRLPDVALTPREAEVLSWLAKGKTNRDIADILGMSPRTVNKHLEHIFEKLGVETRTAAAALASRLQNEHGLQTEHEIGMPPGMLIGAHQ
jgi:DNA-binding response OmpR family regulator